VNINSLVLTYASGVIVSPARSFFTPGWVYVRVGGGAHCYCYFVNSHIITYTYGQLVIG